MLASPQSTGSSSKGGGEIFKVEKLPDESIDKHKRIQDISLEFGAECPTTASLPVSNLQYFPLLLSLYSSGQVGP